MKKSEAKKWIKAFKKAKFKCIVPDKVLEAMKTIGMAPKDDFKVICSKCLKTTGYYGSICDHCGERVTVRERAKAIAIIKKARE